MVASLRLVHSNPAVSNNTEEYKELITKTKRPFRFWDANNKKMVHHRYYMRERKALESCAVMLLFEHIGTIIDVFDIRTARHVATFMVTVNGTNYVPVNTRYHIKERD